MADNAQKYGLRFHSTMTGSGKPSVITHHVATGYDGQPDAATSVDINIGDIVTLLDAGGVRLAAVADTKLYGVVVGVRPYYDGTKMVFGNKLPNSTAYGTILERQSKLDIIPFVPGYLFEIDFDAAATTNTLAGYQALISSNAHFAVSCDAATGKANYRLDTSDLEAQESSEASAHFRFMGVSPTVDNQDFTGNYVKALVAVNESVMPHIFTTGGGA